MSGTVGGYRVVDLIKKIMPGEMGRRCELRVMDHDICFIEVMENFQELKQDMFFSCGSALVLQGAGFLSGARDRDQGSSRIQQVIAG